MNKFIFLLRDAISYCFSWLIIVIIIISFAIGVDSIRISTIAKTLVFCTITSIIFVSVFSSLLLKKTRFITRLSIFTGLFLPVEIGFLYWVRIFRGVGSPSQWFIFIGIIIILYFSSLAIDCLINRRLGKEYTSKLNKYKEGLSHD